MSTVVYLGCVLKCSLGVVICCRSVFWFWGGWVQTIKIVLLVDVFVGGVDTIKSIKFTLLYTSVNSFRLKQWMAGRGDN